MNKEELARIRERLTTLEAHDTATMLAVHALIATHPDRPAALELFSGWSQKADEFFGQVIEDPTLFRTHFDDMYNTHMRHFRLA